VLDADPDLAEGLGVEEAHRAERASQADTQLLEPGRWSPQVGAEGTQATLGLLVLGGLLTREVTLLGRCSVELLGQGDLLRPWQPDAADDAVVPGEAAWTVVEPSWLAVLDRSFQRRLDPWPEVTAALTGRAQQRPPPWPSVWRSPRCPGSISDSCSSSGIWPTDGDGSRTAES